MTGQVALESKQFVPGDGKIAIEARDLEVFYGDFRAVKNVNMYIQENAITAFIGSSGCGKSTVLRSFNRMNDMVASARVAGSVIFQGRNIYAAGEDPIELRRNIGMVFQRPNPLPKSIYDNIAWAAKVNGFKGSKGAMDELVEASLRQAALWDDVKDKLNQSGLALSGGQQQRLCIARAVSVQPEIILMDEPTSALDPVSTVKIEELIQQLKNEFTIVIVTHNMQQAMRSSDNTAFFNMDTDRAGHLVEYGATGDLFDNPQNEQTQQYVSGHFG